MRAFEKEIKDTALDAAKASEAFASQLAPLRAAEEANTQSYVSVLGVLLSWACCLPVLTMMCDSHLQRLPRPFGIHQAEGCRRQATT